MIQTAIQLAVLAWVSYCLVRTLTAPRNAVEVGAEVATRCPRAFAFQTYMKVRDFYLQLSPAHRKYELHGKELMNDVVIDVWEQAGFQLVKHKYRVTRLVPGERMSLVSDRSEVRVLGLFRGVSRSEVEFTFRSSSDRETVLGLGIRIVFPNRLRHLLARLFFTEAIWQAHAKEEMTALARLMEKRYSERANAANAPAA